MSISDDVSKAALANRALNLGERFTNVMERMITEVPANAMKLEAQRIDGLCKVLNLLEDKADRKAVLDSLVAAYRDERVAEANAAGASGVAGALFMKELLVVVKDLGSKGLDVAKDVQAAKMVSDATTNGKVVYTNGGSYPKSVS